MDRSNRQALWNSSEARLRGLLIAGRGGDEQAYLSFLRELSNHLRAFFRRRVTWIPAEAEDLVQETLLAVHNQRHTYDARQPLTAWIHAIAKHKLVDFHRARTGRDALTDPIEDAAEEMLSVQEREAADARIDVEGLLAQLPDRFRLPILYVKLQGLSVREAAQRTGMTESAVKVGVHRGLKKLAARIRGET
ncbi:MAG: sigma-70 family RNA polymerase sigma factor [Rhodocyclaceae bacterium]|nr:sigma-70 family RNA polymerase sigma factor [Rhodocyclaceae bacterium]